jgi:betaine reductase|tara:strand:- start:164 stop:424 length:261 start_codon:yes stop_codon:yes gene_type:complete
VVLGTPTADSSKLFAMTVTEGDPTWAGPLAGAGLGVPAYHVIEETIKSQIDADTYEEEVGLMEMTLEDPEGILKAVAGVRESNGLS